MWVALIIIFAIIMVALDSDVGKFVIGFAVLAIGVLLLSWITGFDFLITLVKGCVAIIVILITGTILWNIKNH